MININAGDTMTVYFNTVDATGAAVAPSAALAASDFSIYKDGSAIQKLTTNGITVTSPFDAKVGCHKIDIDTSNATGDAGFWAAGSSYEIILNTTKTSDIVSLDGLVAGVFGIEYGYMVGTDGANTVVPPTVAQLNARTILSANYFDPAVDTVARVTLVDTTTANTDMVAAPDNVSIAAILVDTGTTIPAQISSLNNLSQANIRTAVGLVSANLDTQLGDVPLLTEMTSSFTEIKGVTWSATTDTLEKIRNATTGGGNTYFNAPILSSQVERTVLNVVVVYEGETSPITITGIKDSSDNPIDLGSYTDLNIVITKKDGKVLQNVVHANITVSGSDSNEVTFTPLAAVSTKGEGGIDLMWSLRDASTGDKVIVSGTMRITKTATLTP